ncbi:MAG TPA: alcohol dehydrogenase catalytic domain-containing protein [Acidimicrobiales bacterium]
MQALVFGVTPGFAPPETADAGNLLLTNLAATPMALHEVADPTLLGDDWVVLRTRLTGICGSDSKQVFMDTGGDATDFAMTAFISFPQVLGHEVVAEVVERGPAVQGLDVGQRVVLQCWLSCTPRGITPVCPACEAGDYSLCWHFTDGPIAPGIHTGNSSDATGGFAELLPAHVSQAITVPDGVSDEVAVLADPFAGSLHGVTRPPPRPGGHALVWGAGALGLSAVAVLRALYPDVAVAVAARHPAQQAVAAQLGATVFDSELDREELVVALADWSGGRLHHPWAGLPIAQPGGIDVCYDTIGAPHTIEVALRVLAARSSLVVSGVHASERYEWSPQYFKEINLVGSNAFGIEEVDGVRQHAIRHYLDLVQAGRVDLTPMLTHTFRLEQWRDAFTTIAKQHETGAIKVAFDFR